MSIFTLGKSIVLASMIQSSPLVLEDSYDFHITSLLSHVQNQTNTSIENIVEQPGYTCPTPHDKIEYYTVKKGDTIKKISEKFGLTEHQIRYLMRIMNPDLVDIPNRTINRNIQIGQSIPIVGDYKDYLSITQENVRRQRLKAWENGDRNYLSQTGFKIYPDRISQIGVKNMLEALVENQRYDPQFTGHPRVVDIAHQTEVICANYIRGTLRESFDLDTIEPELRQFFLTQNIDAWEFFEWFSKIGYTQSHDLTHYFSLDSIRYTYPIIGESLGQRNLDYDRDVIKMIQYLETNTQLVGSLVPFFFRYSKAKSAVYNYNKNRDDLHPNTHQALYVGNDFVRFRADSYTSVINSQIKETLEKNTNVIDYLVDFVIHRSDYGGSYYAHNEVLRNLEIYAEVLNVKIDGSPIDIAMQFSLPPEERYEVKHDSVIEITGVLLTDGLHLSNSSDDDLSENMNGRVRFFWEFMVSGVFLATELLEIPQELHHETIQTQEDKLRSSLVIAGSYFLKLGEQLQYKLRDEIARREFGVDTYKNLTKDQKQRGEYFYTLQIQALQMYGYMQGEGTINPGSFEINAPILYFDTQNIAPIFSQYNRIATQKIIDYNSQTQSCDVSLKTPFIEVVFFSGDHSGKIFTQLQASLYHYIDAYPAFGYLQYLNPVQQTRLLDLIFEKNKGAGELFNIPQGKIPTGMNMIVGLEDTHNIIYKILSENHLPDVELITQGGHTSLDESIMRSISPNKMMQNMLRAILVNEVYVKDCGDIPFCNLMRRQNIKVISKWMHDHGWAEYFGEGVDVINEIFKSNEAYAFALPKIPNPTSAGDFQIRFKNLLVPEDALLLWPTRENLEKATAFILEDQGVYKDILQKLQNSHPDIINADIAQVRKLAELIKNTYENQDRGEEIYDTLQSLFRYNDGKHSNIVGKIISTSLMTDKLEGHMDNVLNWLNRSGYDTSLLYQDEQMLQSFQKMIIHINNMPENKTLYMLGENYIIRALESIAEQEGMDISTQLPTIDVNNKGQIEYNIDIFQSHLDKYANIGEALKFQRKIRKILDVSHMNTETQQRKDFVDLLVREIRILQADPNQLNSNLFSLFQNQEIQDFFRENNRSTSMFPIGDEFDNTELRKIGFRYSNPKNIVGNKMNIDPVMPEDVPKIMITLSAVLIIILGGGLKTFLSIKKFIRRTFFHRI